jgi:hypothetical protein
VTDNRSMNGTMLISLLVDRCLPHRYRRLYTTHTGNLRSIWGRPGRTSLVLPHSTRSTQTSGGERCARAALPRTPPPGQKLGRLGGPR